MLPNVTLIGLILALALVSGTPALLNSTARAIYDIKTRVRIFEGYNLSAGSKTTL